MYTTDSLVLFCTECWFTSVFTASWSVRQRTGSSYVMGEKECARQTNTDKQTDRHRQTQTDRQRKRDELTDTDSLQRGMRSIYLLQRHEHRQT